MAEKSEIKSLLKHKPSYRELFSSFPLVMGLILQADKKRFIKIILLSAVQAPSASLRMYTIKLITDAILNKSVHDFVLALIIMAVTAVVDEITDVAREEHTDLMRYAFERHLTLKTMRHYASLPLATLEDARFRELSQAFRDRKGVALGVAEMFAQFPAIAFSFIGVATAVIYIPWFVVVVLALSFILRFMLMLRVPHFNWSVLNYETRQGRMGNAFMNYLTRIRHLVQCKILGLPEYYEERWDGIFLEGQAEKFKALRASTWANLSGELLRSGGYLLGMGYVGWKVMKQAVAFSSLTVFMSAYGNLSMIAQRLAMMLARLQKDWMFIPLYERFFQVKPEKDVGSPVPQGALRIEFKNVWFKYPGKETFALKGVNQIFETGERIALTGVNGAGKTTLIRLLLGVYAPTQGQILVNGVNLQDIRPSAWFKDLSYVAQDPPMFEDTLDELIRHGRVDEDLAEDGLQQAAATVDFDRVVEKLEGGWRTHIGKELAHDDEEGHELSGGQVKQLIIVRQMYRLHSRIFILDEGAANLDQKRQALFYQSTAMLQDKLVIHATHDREALKHVDRIVELPSPERLDADEAANETIMSYKTGDMS